MLYNDDRVQVRQITLASPLVLIIAAMGAGGAPHVLKAWADVLSAGLNLRERAQALEENRTLARHRLRAAELNNELTEQKIRQARAEADIAENAREERFDVAQRGDPDELPIDAREERLDVAQRGDPDELPIDSVRRANSLTADEYALLLDDPMHRILEYGGGDIRITN